MAAMASFLLVLSVSLTATMGMYLNVNLTSFDQFVAAYVRGYAENTKEYDMRGELFKRRMSLILAHNANPERSWTAGVNHHLDRTDDELRRLLGWRRSGPSESGSHEENSPLSFLTKATVKQPPLAASVDWRGLSMATDVPDQGSCGSCWAVAASSMLAGRHEAQLKSVRSFSVQELVDCVPNPQACGGTGGCEGATVELALKYAQQYGLLDTTTSPYMGREIGAKQCAGSSGKPAFLDKNSGGRVMTRSWEKLPENRALPLMRAAMDGPVAISVAAGDWFFYESGIFDSCKQDAVIDHAVNLFGYGTDGSKKYWLVRNSWGNGWGEGGYIRLLRGATPEQDERYCGTDNDPKAGTACAPYPSKVTVCGMCGMLYDSVVAHF